MTETIDAAVELVPFMIFTNDKLDNPETILKLGTLEAYLKAQYPETYRRIQKNEGIFLYC